jgi:hypothetical protein
MRWFGLSNCRDSASPLYPSPPPVLLFAIRLMIFEIATGDKSLDLVIPVFRHCLGFWISRVLVFIVCLFEREREREREREKESTKLAIDMGKW